MTPEKQAELRAVIVAACPELMELTFGCEVQPYYEDIEGGRILYEHSICRKHKKYSSCNEDCEYDEGFTILCGYEEDGFYQMTFKKTDKYTVFGHEPQLAHVLRAIGESWAVDGEGKFIERCTGFFILCW